MSLDLVSYPRQIDDHDMDNDEARSSEESGSSPLSSSPEMESPATLPSPSNSLLPAPPHASTSRTASKLSASSVTRLSPSIYARPCAHSTTTMQAPTQPRTRPRGLSPLTPSTNTCSPFPPLGVGALPKAQPLARALFAKMANGTDVPHAGMGKKKGGQKLIVPSKSFKTSFELKLTSSELARQ
ncbi:hypothetical protein BD324DRAFT_318225 [Kockovaella imperatae]|uniref:Uncharacterized protein n=1 Tax=Kockovaella imperatae TaxID=4999 RepID=A0A1Y1UNV0_9TREE|nr:hypothetical protein BD324DRAFT_318225 [Kockovaella imperatae]ORX39217.1 hypothetical protein BD324DRAFT_318225 [Kockovaella imperatae]